MFELTKDMASTLKKGAFALPRTLRDLIGNAKNLNAAASSPTNAESSNAEARRFQKRAQRSQAQLDALRGGPLFFFPLEELAKQACPACESKRLHLAGYPYTIVPQFARLVTLWCSDCGLGFVPSIPFDLANYYATEYGSSNRNDRGVIAPAKYFDESARTAMPPSVQRYFARAERQISAAKRHMAEIGTMLDFGSGPGYALHLSGAQTKHAVEYDENSLPYLAHIGAQRTTLEELQEGYYDLILSSHSLEHLTIETLYPTLDSLKRALKPDGLLLVEVPGASLANYRALARHDPHTLFFSGQSFRKVIERAGFEVVSAFNAAKASNPILLDPPYAPPATGDLFTTTPSGGLTILARPKADTVTAAPLKLSKGSVGEIRADKRGRVAKSVKQELLARFKRDGYLLLPSLVDGASIPKLPAHLRDQDHFVEHDVAVHCQALLMAPQLTGHLDALLRKPACFLQGSALARHESTPEMYLPSPAGSDAGVLRVFTCVEGPELQFVLTAGTGAATTTTEIQVKPGDVLVIAHPTHASLKEKTPATLLALGFGTNDTPSKLFYSHYRDRADLGYSKLNTHLARVLKAEGLLPKFMG